MALAEPTMIGEVVVVGGAVTYGFIKLGEYLWEQVSAHTQVDTIADTKNRDDPYVLLVHFIDEQGKLAIEKSKALTPRGGHPLYLAAPREVVGKTPREIEYSLGLKPGRGEYYFLVKVRESQVLPAGPGAPCEEFPVNRGGGLQFITYEEIPRAHWVFQSGMPTGRRFGFCLE